MVVEAKDILNNSKIIESSKDYDLHVVHPSERVMTIGSSGFINYVIVNKEFQTIESTESFKIFASWKMREMQAYADSLSNPPDNVTKLRSTALMLTESSDETETAH